MTPKGLDIHIVKDKRELDQVLKVREVVFILGQKVDWDEEMDGLEDQATHIIALLDNNPVGCARLRIIDDRAKLERIAVLHEYRKMGIGIAITNFLVEQAKKKGVREAYMHAQIYANDFYKKCGFKPRGEEFMEAGIVHKEMYMSLR